MTKEERELLDKYNRTLPEDLKDKDWQIYLYLIEQWREEQKFPIINFDTNPISKK